MIYNKKLMALLRAYPGDTRVQDIIDAKKCDLSLEFMKKHSLGYYENSKSLDIAAITIRRLQNMVLRLTKENAQLRAKMEDMKDEQ